MIDNTMKLSNLLKKLLPILIKTEDICRLKKLHIDECEQISSGTSAEKCDNTDGRYTCTCATEYMIMATAADTHLLWRFPFPFHDPPFAVLFALYLSAVSLA